MRPLQRSGSSPPVEVGQRILSVLLFHIDFSPRPSVRIASPSMIQEKHLRRPFSHSRRTDLLYLLVPRSILRVTKPVGQTSNVNVSYVGTYPHTLATERFQRTSHRPTHSTATTAFVRNMCPFSRLDILDSSDLLSPILVLSERGRTRLADAEADREGPGLPTQHILARRHLSLQLHDFMAHDHLYSRRAKHRMVE